MVSTHQVPLVQQCWTADFASWNDRFYQLCLTSLETVYEVPYAITRFLAAPQLMLDLVPPVPCHLWVSSLAITLNGCCSEPLFPQLWVSAEVTVTSSSIGRWKGNEEPWPFLALILLHGYKFTDVVPITSPTVVYRLAMGPCNSYHGLELPKLRVKTNLFSI